jgi:OmpA-OmpF porin, OOP family
MECSLRNRSRSFRLALAVSLATPGVALCADNGVYFGGSVGDVSSDYEPGFASVGAPQDDDGFKLIGGFRPLDALALEANYVDLGTTRVPLNLVCITLPCPSEASIDSRAVSASVVGLFSLPLVDLYGRVGVARWEAERRTVVSQDDSGTDPTYGAGVQLRFGSFALRVEYERFDFGDDSADLRSVGFTYTFL